MMATRAPSIAFGIICFASGSLTSAFAQTPGVAAHNVQRVNEVQALDMEMVDHQAEMKVLATSLNDSFQAIAAARGPNGYVVNKSVIRVHNVHIKALRVAVRDHKLFDSEYEHLCKVTDKQRDVMVQHQQQMKGVLYDVVESFDTFEQTNDQPNNPNIDITMYIGPAFIAHRDALKELSTVIAQHQQAMVKLIEKCEPLSSVPATPNSTAPPLTRQ